MNRLKELCKKVTSRSDNQKKFHEFWDGIEGSAVDKLNELTQNSKGKINVVGYQLIQVDGNGFPITYILVEEDG